MVEKIEGIVVSEQAYGETSKIIRILTKDRGVIGVLAKGAKKIKSDLRNMTGKLTYGYFYMHYKEEKLSNLVSVDIINSFKNIRKNISLISYASFLLELSEQVERHSNNNSIFSILISTLKKMDEGYDPLVLMNIVELKYLSLLGVMPNLDGCASCGSTNDIVALSNIKGGYVCKNCHTTEKIISSKTLKLIRMFNYIDIDKISNIDVSLEVKNEINNFLDEYYDTYTGLYLKSKQFLKELSKVVTDGKI